MGHAVEKMHHASARRRPGKTLREDNHYTGNLTAYTGVTRPGSSNVRTTHRRSFSQIAQARASREFVQLGSQPSDQIAANSDSAITTSVPPFDAASRSQIAIAVISCLSLGAILGYNWSNSVGHNMVLDTRVIPDATPVMTRPAESDMATGSVSAAPLAPIPALQSVDAQPVAPLGDTTVVDVEKYLDEINWLKQQNKDLQFELDVLTAESTDLNYELLQLDLEVAALKLQSEPPTETRIVYNFVDTPIGDTAMDAQAANSRPTTAVSSSGPASDNLSFSSGSNALDLPINEPEPEEAYSITDEELLNEAMSEDEREEMLWELYNGGQATDSEVIYDPETGFYINPQFDGQDPVYSGEEVNDYFPPINDP